MQREIKFRGISVDTKKFVYGYYVERTESHDKCHKIYDPLDGTWHPVKAETVGQYTGQNDNTKWEDLTEKERAEWAQIEGNFPSEWKGREIFEGHVLKVFNWGHRTKDDLLGIVSVVWDTDEKGWGYSDKEVIFGGDRYDLFRNVEIKG